VVLAAHFAGFAEQPASSSSTSADSVTRTVWMCVYGVSDSTFRSRGDSILRVSHKSTSSQFLRDDLVNPALPLPATLRHR
jgi:hypothetical protein